MCHTRLTISLSHVLLSTGMRYQDLGPAGTTTSARPPVRPCSRLVRAALDAMGYEVTLLMQTGTRAGDNPRGLTRQSIPHLQPTTAHPHVLRCRARLSPPATPSLDSPSWAAIARFDMPSLLWRYLICAQSCTVITRPIVVGWLTSKERKWLSFQRAPTPWPANVAKGRSFLRGTVFRPTPIAAVSRLPFMTMTLEWPPRCSCARRRGASTSFAYVFPCGCCPEVNAPAEAGC